MRRAAKAAVCKTVTRKHRWFKSTLSRQFVCPRCLEDYIKLDCHSSGLITANAMTGIPEWKKAIDAVLQKSGMEVFNVPEYVGVRIGVDTSGSMATRVTSSLTAVDIASLFGSMVYMSMKNASVYAVASM